MRRDPPSWERGLRRREEDEEEERERVRERLRELDVEDRDGEGDRDRVADRRERGDRDCEAEYIWVLDSLRGRDGVWDLDRELYRFRWSSVPEAAPFFSPPGARRIDRFCALRGASGEPYRGVESTLSSCTLRRFEGGSAMGIPATGSRSDMLEQFGGDIN